MLTREFIDVMKVELAARKEAKAIELQNPSRASLAYKDIVRIDFAIKRMQEGQYGICTNCGTLIGMELLKCIPETPLCSYCIRALQAQ